jgi:hypothetical protein
MVTGLLLKAPTRCSRREFEVKRFKRPAALDAKPLGKVSEASIVAVVTKGTGDLKALTDRMSAGDIKAVAK